MGSAGVFFLVVVAAILAIAGFAIGVYNQLVRLMNRYKNAFAQIEVQLKRRHDLIPNLVETAKGYMKHERETLEEVVLARNQAVSGLQNAKKNPGSPEEMQALGGLEEKLTASVSRLFALMEAYPDLKANENMLRVQEELTSTENKVAFARQSYNDSVMRFNTYKQEFPAVVLAGFFGFSEDAGLLEFDSAAIEEAPKVTF